MLLNEMFYDNIFQSIDRANETYPLKDLFIRFSNSTRFEINPNFGFNTPVGLYAYPAEFLSQGTQSIIQSFASDRKYAGVFYTSEYWDLSEPITQQTISSLYAACEHFNLMPDYELKYAKSNAEAYLVIQNVYLKAAGYGPNSKQKQNPNQILTQIFQHAGFSGIVDRGAGVIHMNEPHQGVFFDKSKLKIVDFISI